MQVVRQWIPDRRTSHTESPSAIGAELVTRYDQEPLGSGAKMLPWCDTCDWLAQFHEVLRHLTVQTVEHHDAEFVQLPVELPLLSVSHVRSTHHFPACYLHLLLLCYIPAALNVNSSFTIHGSQLSLIKDLLFVWLLHSRLPLDLRLCWTIDTYNLRLITYLSTVHLYFTKLKKRCWQLLGGKQCIFAARCFANMAYAVMQCLSVCHIRTFCLSE